MSQQEKRFLKIFFHAMDGIGHLNACVGLSQALAKRGHRIYFLVNDAFKGQYAKYGFDEILLHQAKSKGPEESEGQTEKKNPVKEMAEKLKENGFLGPKSPVEKLRDHLERTKEGDEMMEVFLQQAIDYNPQIAAVIERELPDLFIIDSFLIPPAIKRAPLPWIYSFSANPNFLYRSDKLPPFGSGKLLCGPN